LPRRRPRRRVNAQHLLQWFAYLMIVSVPIIVLAIAYYPQPVRQDEPVWTRTVAQTSKPQVTIASPKKAAILDQVSTYSMNQELIENVRRSLGRAGYGVEVFSGAQITVELYRGLPSRQYDVIILRVHSTATVELESGRVGTGAPTVLLTGEPYEELRYPYEQMMGQVCRVKIDAGIFFGISAKFVAESMGGTFRGTLIVLAGCESLANKDMAKALVARGASQVIGWSDSVGLDHNDKAILSLARNLFEKKLSIPEAIQATMSEIGKDPVFQSYLLHYP